MMTNTLHQRLRDQLNFLITNIGPRRAWSRMAGRISQWRQPLFTQIALWIWNQFDPLELQDSPPQRYASIQDCFTRPLKPGARTVDTDPETLCSPCDGILGAHGCIENGMLFQLKGKPYALHDLVGPIDAIHPWRHGHFLTIRIKSNMYHRFHSPCKGTLMHSQYFPGDTWNVNPPTLARVNRLFCRNERACLHIHTSHGDPIALVPVAAIWVAGIRVHALAQTDWRETTEPRPITPGVEMNKGEEIGWFEHGSSILLISPASHHICEGLKEGDRIWMGQALMRRCADAT
jgi:phosphatidylserine decarboxylase